MKKDHENRKYFLRIIGSGVVVVFGILSVLGSGGGSGDKTVTIPSGQTPSTIKAFNFNSGNTITAGQFAVSAMAFFSDLSAIGQLILTTLAASDPGNSPFDLAMCKNTGTSKLAWIDADLNGDISIGDSATLTFNNCDLDGSGTTAAGTVQLGVTSVDPDPLPTSAGFNVSVNVAITDSPDTTTYTGSFAETTSTADNTNYTFVYTANDAAGHQLSVTKNGSPLYQFGCFSVTKAFSIADDPGTYMLSPSGVINASEFIMSLASGPNPLSFVKDWMEAGTKRLLSLSAPACAALGVSNGVSDSDGSYIDMEALGGGSLRLHTFDASDVEFYNTDTSWDALLI